ncbi:MAG: sulfatase, partial [Armatimonadota bacterium]
MSSPDAAAIEPKARRWLRDALAIAATGVLAGFVIGIARAIPRLAALRFGDYDLARMLAAYVASWAASHMVVLGVFAVGIAAGRAVLRLSGRAGAARALLAVGIMMWAACAGWLWLVRGDNLWSLTSGLAPAVAGKVGFSGGLILVAALSGWVIGAAHAALADGRRRGETAAGAGQKARRRRLWHGLLLASAVVASALVTGLVLASDHLSPRPNVIVIVVDALRADHLGCYGYQRPTSPNIDALAREGTLFEDATSQAPWTLPSMSSFMTGLYPSAHGAGSYRTSEDKWTWIGLPQRAVTLAEQLSAAGYRTASFVTVPFVSTHFGHHQGFQHMDESLLDEPESAVTSARVSDNVIAWLRHNRTRPLFIYAHYFDPHHPYMPQPKYDYTGGYKGRFPPTMSHDELQVAARDMTTEDVAYFEALYDGEISFTDEQIGRVLAELRRLGIADRTLVILTADHGEEFREHRAVAHGLTVFRPALRVPLIMACPGRVPPGKRVATAVQLTDVYPTVLDMCRLAAPGGLHGRSLARLMAGHRWTPRSILSEAWVHWEHDHWIHMTALRRGRFKLIMENDVPRYFFDLGDDPKEERNLLGKGV